MGDALEPLPPPDSLVKVRIGNREYNARRVPGCLTCQHPSRMEIERMLVEGHPYAVIADAFSGMEYTVGRQKKILPRIDWTSIRNHFRQRHMPVDAQAVREIAEQRLRELGRHIEDLQERSVDSYMTARLVMHKGFDRLAHGDAVPSVRETLMAAKLLEEFDLARKDQEGAGQEAWQEAMMIYFKEAKQLMPPDTWGEFVRRLMVNPQLRSLAARLDGERPAESAEYVEAEVIEPERSSNE